MAISWQLTTLSSERRARALRGFLVSSSVIVCYSLFDTPLQEHKFGLVGQQRGRLLPVFPCGATLTPDVFQGDKTGLVLGDFKFQFQ
jgi:hypothetical protein